MAAYRYLLDTNTVSYFAKGANDGLVARMVQGFSAQDMAISAIVRAELRYAVALMAANDQRRARMNLLLL